jgi:hypothetical protein
MMFRTRGNGALGVSLKLPVKRREATPKKFDRPDAGRRGKFLKYRRCWNLNFKKMYASRGAAREVSPDMDQVRKVRISMSGRKN